MENNLFTSARVNVESVLDFLKENPNMPASFLEKGLGYGLTLRQGDEITLSNHIVVCSMGKSLITEEGTFDKCYLAIEVTVKTSSGAQITGDLPAASFVRTGRKYATLEEESKNSPNLRGLDLYEALLKELKLSKEVEAFNRALTLRESALTKLKKLCGKTLKVVAAKTAYRLRFKPVADRPEGYGDQAKDWEKISILFFEDTTAPVSAKPEE